MPVTKPLDQPSHENDFIYFGNRIKKKKERKERKYLRSSSSSSSSSNSIIAWMKFQSRWWKKAIAKWKSYEIDGKKEKEANKHEKVNGMVKWNYLGHRRTVDPNKVKGMAKIENYTYVKLNAHIIIWVDR